MIATCKICKSDTCTVQVKGLEKDSDQYLDEEQISIRNYTFEQTITLNVLYSIDSKENQTRDSYSIVPHTDIDEDEITMETDGLKQIDHFIIPTNLWFNYVAERDLNAFNDYSIVYFFNIEDEKFYKYISGLITEVSIDEIIEVNTEGTTLVKTSVNTFQLCHLEECFFQLCLYLLNNMPCSDPCLDVKAKGFKGEILNRDIIWMAINAIKYCIDLGQFYRAQALLEQIETCWGICKNLNNNLYSSYSGCGCSQ